ncbi:protein-L-isoaspartate O-methyltransferase family protein [Microvirga mediterraneensis]|uniref:Protein-L-isoaspartate O-methyltransferase n=1 Tax=Microvirga mediterraneensis TaxID=2754695 RepID=A0A838BJA3_9HYPH|nr:methyltransferase domain-containing protein [Microvirga mediterraneensis]MBA1155255.1 methyltransferase domain-containing protein [Microvirga mediterraneensis]
MESVFNEHELAVIRRAFAKQIMALSGTEADAPLEEAFAAVPRERFLGDPPWQMSRVPRGYEAVLSHDPAVLYQDTLFALLSHRGVNNGSPSLHARWLHAMALREGERVAHLGAGSGYYTAIMAQLVGSQGHVYAVEFDSALAERARASLSDTSNVTVIEGDGAEWPREGVDAVYVNFSVERPADAWIDCLQADGRLIFPLGVPRPKPSPSGGTHSLYGAGLCVTRKNDDLSVRCLGPASFVCAEGRLSPGGPEREVLHAAFERSGIEFVRSLIWKRNAPPGRCWFTGSGWALSYDEIAG